MEITEDKDLARVKEVFTNGIKLFNNRQYKEAMAVFGGLLDENGSSQAYAVIEVLNRAKSLKKICDVQLSTRKTDLNSNEDYLYDGIFNLNSGNLDEALERFLYLKDKNHDPAYVNYLVSLVHLKKGETEECFKYLGDAIDLDPIYKVIAHNEADFDPLFENTEFATKVDMGHGV